MALYSFICHKCKIIYEKEYSMSNAPKKSKCPECNKLCEKNWADWADVGFQFHGEGFYTNQKRAKDFEKYGFDKEEGDKFLKESIDASKKRMKSGWQHYARYSPNMEGFKASGKAKKLTEEQVVTKAEKTKKIVEEVYTRHKQDPTMPNKPQ